MSLFPHVQFLLSVAAPPQLPADLGLEIAFAGRSNSGKSTAINAIVGRKALARASKTPGRTRLLNYFALAEGQRLVDLPGYGYAEVSNAERRIWLPMLAALRERQSMVGLLLIVDSRRGVRDEDFGLIEWADPTRRRVHVLLAKTDKLKRAEAVAALREARAALAAAGLVTASTDAAVTSPVTVQLFSAHDGTGVAEAQRVLLAMAGR